MNTKEHATDVEQKTEELWKAMEARQGETFYTAKNLPFRYTIRGGEMFVDRRSRSITRATFANALEKLRARPDEVRGPKSLSVFGAPYVWALLVAFGIANGTAAKPDENKAQDSVEQE